jgi:hypothetical protein
MSNNGTVLSPSSGYLEYGYHGGGIAIDTSGDVWIGEFLGAPDTVIELSNTGTTISPNGGFTGGGLIDSEGIAIDASGNIWVANFGGPVSELSSSGTPIAGSPFSADGVRIAIDGSGNIWTGNYGGSVSELSNSGVLLSPSTGFIGPNLYQPYSIAVDGSGNVWLSNGADMATNVTEFVGIASPVVTPLAVGLKNHTLGTRP